MSDQRLAVIDLGSNSFRLVVFTWGERSGHGWWRRTDEIYEAVRVGAGLDAVPRGQTEAALALGLRPRQVFVKIVLPQALRVIYPALTSQIVIMMLESAVVSQIAVRELTYEADMLQARTFRAFETYFVVTMVYLVLSMGLRRLLVSGGRRVLGAGVS